MVGQTYSLSFDYQNPTGPQAATGFRLYINGVKTGSDISLSALSGGSATVAALVAPVRGSYILEVTAFNADAESAKSTPALQLVSRLGVPPVPSNVRIILAVSVASDGTIKLEYRGVEFVPQDKP